MAFTDLEPAHRAYISGFSELLMDYVLVTWMTEWQTLMVPCDVGLGVGPS